MVFPRIGGEAKAGMETFDTRFFSENEIDNLSIFEGGSSRAVLQKIWELLQSHSNRTGFSDFLMICFAVGTRQMA